MVSPFQVRYAHGRRPCTSTQRRGPALRWQLRQKATTRPVGSYRDLLAAEAEPSSKQPASMEGNGDRNLLGFGNESQLLAAPCILEEPATVTGRQISETIAVSAEQTSQIVAQLVRGCGTCRRDRCVAEAAWIEVRLLSVDEAHTNLAQLCCVGNAVLVKKVVRADTNDSGRNAFEIRQYGRGLDRLLRCST